MSTGGALVQGLLGGFESGQRIVGNIDNRKRQIKNDQMAMDQLANDRQRNELLFKQGQEDREFAKEDRLRQLARLDDADAIAAEQRSTSNAMDERRLQLAELSAEQQRRVSNAQLSNTMTQQQIGQLELSQITQNNKAKEAMGIASQAQEMFKQGNLKQGLALYSELDKYGLGTKQIMDGEYSAQEAEDVVSGLLSGDTSLDKPEAKTLMKTLLQPSFLASGRDPEKFEATGIRESRPGFFAIEITNKETGEIVPATDLQTAEGGDPITEVSQESLMQTATTWLGMAREIEGGQRAMKAQQQIAGLQARMLSDRTSGKGNSRSNDEDTSLPQNQQAFIELQETESDQALAKFLIAKDGYTENITTKMRRVKELRDEEGGTIAEALKSYEEEFQIDAVVAKRVMNLVNRGVDEKAAERLERRLIDQDIGREQYEREVTKLVNKTNGNKVQDVPVEQISGGVTASSQEGRRRGVGGGKERLRIAQGENNWARGRGATARRGINQLASVEPEEEEEKVRRTSGGRNSRNLNALSGQ